MAKKKTKNNRIKLGKSLPGNRLSLWVVVILIAIAGTKLIFSSLAATSNFTLLATHPQAALQPTALGKTIQTLKAWNGKIYAGYGDYGANTGPIDITPFDPQTNTFAASSEVSDLTEAIDIFRILGGRLYAPSTDPRYGYSTDYSVASSANGVASWSQISSLQTAHAFDMATLTGSDLWLVGSAYGDTTPGVWRSLDGGATWTNVLSVPPPNTSYDNNRFYFAGVYGGKLYVQGYFWSSSTGSAYVEPNSHVFDGAVWSKGPNILAYGGMGHHPETFAGKMVLLGWEGQPYATSLVAFDGNKSQLVTAPSTFWDYTVDGGTLYALGYNSNVYSTTDLVNWYQNGTAPTTARSIAILNGQIYVGTTDSKLYSAPVPGTPIQVTSGGGKGAKINNGKKPLN